MATINYYDPERGSETGRTWSELQQAMAAQQPTQPLLYNAPNQPGGGDVMAAGGEAPINWVDVQRQQELARIQAQKDAEARARTQSVQPSPWGIPGAAQQPSYYYQGQPVYAQQQPGQSRGRQTPSMFTSYSPQPVPSPWSGQRPVTTGAPRMPNVPYSRANDYYYQGAVKGLQNDPFTQKYNGGASVPYPSYTNLTPDWKGRQQQPVKGGSAVTPINLRLAQPTDYNAQYYQDQRMTTTMPTQSYAPSMSYGLRQSGREYNALVNQQNALLAAQGKKGSTGGGGYGYPYRPYGYGGGGGYGRNYWGGYGGGYSSPGEEQYASGSPINDWFYNLVNWRI